MSRLLRDASLPDPWACRTILLPMTSTHGMRRSCTIKCTSIRFPLAVLCERSRTSISSLGERITVCSGVSRIVGLQIQLRQSAYSEVPASHLSFPRATGNIVIGPGRIVDWLLRSSICLRCNTSCAAWFLRALFTMERLRGW